MKDDWIKKGLAAKRESKYVEFKEEFDPASKGAWCELVKDIVALANSGGGVILVGLTNAGRASGKSVKDTLAVDPATVTDKIKRYTGRQYAGARITETKKGRQKIAALVMEGTDLPLVFEKAGQYVNPAGKEKVAFAAGTVYFRHGAKSEPANNEDLSKLVERRLEMIRKAWNEGVRRVTTAPPGSQVAILAKEVVQSAKPGATPIRITEDKSAPGYRLIDPDETYPYRQTELVKKVKKGLPKGVTFTSYDAQALKQKHKLDGKPEFFYCSKHGSPQYSPEVVAWIVEQSRKDKKFFDKAREHYYNYLHA